ncbi:erythromycin esterase family protein [Burkholderia thailandensis]|uniref:erythromycin esterase family protein n=1 Tax=Burkholderia thailandensis TaxID=57975 RepID=UPI001376566B|nr:erythromycin esterase family protein [Burkholderia thailandensis]MBS2129110.1 erythromycin esterase family protein [Burkholderia thailandensis]MCS3398701.1 erythromycin esterase family protein [Burkholderia thailandensis]MCS6507253.1 erythromycin esterase family protein [Burkholderia thailandensis]MCS6513937.1 erythromycin esterase family protein [Burkholderia thailandensis]NBD04478.1 erythromycin esterase family protein [Burkholderia thailandensis]
MHPAKTPFLAVRDLARRLRGDAADFDALIDMADDADVVLLGESTHGTDEFYRMRARITARLVDECGFDTIAIEGDWPDAWRVNRYVQGDAAIADADAALADFTRFPAWMWRNRPMREFVGWLRERNATLPRQSRSGVYGLDLYSLYRCADAVIRYLDDVDPGQAELARQRYAALDHVREPSAYGYAVASGARPAATAGALEQLRQLREREAAYLAHDGIDALDVLDAQFFAEHNAQVVVNAEAYYRAMFGSRANTWNLRDAHMRDTLFALRRHRVRGGGAGRAVVWAHNSHVGDARATEMYLRGEWTLGQLVREALGERALSIGFTAYTGHVSAASHWDGDVEQKWMRPALPGSYEHLFHATGLDRFFLPLRETVAQPLGEALLERAIGVIYLPQTERGSHYFVSSITGQFDALFHLDETSPLEPLAPPGAWHPREEPVSAP